ncbi:hypothetical protein WJX84_002793 [Apatococcus fuscideae]|uniref:Uncharacterized protein n=1 Tax=Apatococcus fuscideae TaxID=2026836 RepID=A0AAW1TFB7_9CHLO
MGSTVQESHAGSEQNLPSFAWAPNVIQANEGQGNSIATNSRPSKLRPVRAPRRASPFQSPADAASPADGLLMKVRGWKTPDAPPIQSGLAADDGTHQDLLSSKRKLSALAESPRNTPDSLEALHRSAGAMRKLQAELKRAAAASPWAVKDQPPASSSMALVPVNAPLPAVSVTSAANQGIEEDSWREADHWRQCCTATQTELAGQTVHLRELQTSLLQAQMLSEKWQERAAQRASLAQNNADLHGRLDRAQSRNHEQQETIEHLQAEVRAGGRRFQEMANLTAAKQSAVEEQAAHMTTTMQRLQTAIATKDTLIAELQTRLVGREEAGEAVRASQEAHRESLLQECAALRLQTGEGAVREMQLRAELETARVQLQASAALRSSGAQELERRLCNAEDRLIQAHAEAASLRQQHQEIAEAADSASRCAAQTDALLVSERQTCEELRTHLTQASEQAHRADELEQQLSEAQQSLQQQQSAAEEQEGLVLAAG